MEEEGYVHRIVDDTNRKAKKLYLTSKGKDIIPELIRAYSAWTDVITGSLSPSEIRTAIKLVGRVAAGAYEYLGDVRLADKMQNNRVR